MEAWFFETQFPETSRFDEIQRILTYCKQGESSQIISIPGAGRSNLLGLLAYNKQIRILHLQDQKETYHFVLINFSEIRNKPQIDATKLMFLNIVASLEERPLEGVYEKAKKIFQENLSYNDELVLFQGLKKVLDMLTQEKQLTVVLLFDNFDTYIPMLTPEFFTHLRVLRNRAKYRFSLVFSLSKPLEYLLEPSLFADFAEFVEDHVVYLRLHDPESLSFRMRFLEKTIGKTLDKQLKNALIRLTAGHSRLTRLAIQAVLSSNNVILNLFQNPKEIPDQVRDDSFRFHSGNNSNNETMKQLNNQLITFLLSQKPIRATLEEIWNTLNPAEQTHFLKDLYPSVLSDEHSTYLQNVGLMTDTAIALPLFAAFVTQKKQTVTRDARIIFHKETNTITKSDQELSDKLTATEFRLLTFFLQESNKVLDRETIIANVWKDNKSLAGVTDQALDQLIFRLRRKIEEDPNNPTYLQTVKGRGFIFSP